MLSGIAKQNNSNPVTNISTEKEKVPTKKKKINFIERNKNSVNKISSSKTVMSNDLNDNMENPHTCLPRRLSNESEKIQNTNHLILETSNPIEFDISIISNNSSVLSDIINPLNKFHINKLASNKIGTKSQTTTTTNSSLFKFDSGLTKSNFEEFTEGLNTQNDVNSHFEPLITEECQMNSTKGEDLEKTDLTVSYVNVLTQGCVDNQSTANSLNEIYDYNDNEVNIVQDEENNVIKVRTQLKQRSALNVPKKRQITPNLIENHIIEKNTQSIPCKDPISHYNEQLLDKNSQNEFNFNEVVMTAVSEPLARIQTQLENKMNNVLTELEFLRKTDEILSAQLVEKQKKQRSVEIDNEINDFNESKLKKEETESRIKYLENLQEKQFDMMSQLINVIGKENTSANSIASSGRESLNRFRQMFEITEPIINPADYFQYSHDFYSDIDTGNKQKNEHNSLKSKNCEKVKKLKPKNGGKIKSRSRSQNKNDKDKNQMNSRYCCKTKLPKSRSPSRSLSQGGQKSNSCENTNKISSDKKRSDFLEELLDNNVSNNDINVSNTSSTKSTKINSPIAKKLESRSVASVFEDNIYDNQPTLFDRYLNEAKNANNKLYEKTTENNSEPDEEKKDLKNQFSPEKISMFNDIKEVLKAVEYSKSQIDMNVNDALRARDIKIFNLANAHLNDKSERMRMKKLVDGCVSAISNDVQKEVSQKLIDETKNIKLEAERDTTSNNGPYSHRNIKKIQGNYQKVNDIKSRSTVGFGSSAQRSISTNDKKKSTQSESSKYIGKIFGKNLLDQIKLDDLEEKNQKMKEQLEEQKELKKKLELQKMEQNKFNLTQKSSSQSSQRLFKNISNKKSIKMDLENEKLVNKKIINEFTPNIPSLSLNSSSKMAFKTCPIKKSDNISNVALVTITPRDISPPKLVIKDLKRQNLPSLSINPTTQANIINLKESITLPEEIKPDLNNDKKIVNESVNSSIDLNQSGAGIFLPGSVPGYQQNTNNHSYIPNNNQMSIDELNQLSNDTNNFLKHRNLMEKKAFDWIEHELISRFITNLAQNGITPNENEINNSIDPNKLIDFDLEEEPAPINYLKDLNILGAEGMRLMMDLGSQVDTDFMEALARECLEEKVCAVIQYNLNSKKVEENQVPPIASPRKGSLDRNNLQNLEFNNNYEVKTAVVTPKNEIVPGNYTIGTQVSFETKEQKIYDQPKVVPVVEPLPEQTKPEVIQYFEDSESLLEETMTETAEFDVQNNDNNSYEMNIPNTPSITLSCEDLDNLDPPTISEITPLPRTPSPKHIQHIKPALDQKSTSMQCGPISEPKIQPKKIIIRQPEVDINDLTSETMDLTESTQYNTSSNTTSISSIFEQTEEDCNDSVDESYFSEGAWLLSKSEGQIIDVINSNKKIVNTNIKIAGHKNELVRQTGQGQRKKSDGELKISLINGKNMELYVESDAAAQKYNKKTDFLNGSESGEVLLVPKKNYDQYNSDGEFISDNKLESKKNEVVNNEIQIKSDLKKSLKSKKSSKNKLKSLKKEDKTLINLSLSPEKQAGKNNIQIQSIPNEILVRDSADIERKIYSSTPDQSMHIVQPIATTFIDEEDFSNYTNYTDEDGDENEKTLELSPIKKKESKNHNGKKRSGKNKNREYLELMVLASSDFNTEKDEESMANASDIEK